MRSLFNSFVEHFYTSVTLKRRLMLLGPLIPTRPLSYLFVPSNARAPRLRSPFSEVSGSVPPSTGIYFHSPFQDCMSPERPIADGTLGYIISTMCLDGFHVFSALSLVLPFPLPKHSQFFPYVEIHPGLCSLRRL